MLFLLKSKRWPLGMKDTLQLLTCVQTPVLITFIQFSVYFHSRKSNQTLYLWFVLYIHSLTSSQPGSGHSAATQTSWLFSSTRTSGKTRWSLATLEICPGFVSEASPDRICLKHLPRKISRQHPYHINLFKAPPDNWTPQLISKQESSHRSEEIHFSCLYLVLLVAIHSLHP